MTDQDDLPFEEVGEVFKSLSGERRVKAFYLMGEGMETKKVAEEVDVTRQGVQRYIDSWKENGLIRSEGNDYVFTEEGEDALELVVDALNRF